MNKQKSMQAQNLARKMLIEGESFDSVMEATNLRLKDLKKIREEINSHF
ncbi:MAG: hypothetical protein ACI398_04460 [Clostridium sp.]